MRTMRRRATHVFQGAALAFLLPLPLAAQTPDYSRGFEILLRLGLPDTKEWKYVQLPQADSFGSRLRDWKRTGNAWLESAPDADGITRVTSDGITLLGRAAYNPQDRETAMALMRKLQERGLLISWDGAGGREREGDEAADAAALVQVFQSELAKGERSRTRYLLSDPDSLAQIFFHAAHWHRRGHEKEAADLVNLLMQHLPRKAALFEVALRSIANQRQLVAVMKFGASGDWAALSKEMEGILADFPGSWPERPLTVRLLERVNARAAGSVTPVRGDEAFPLTPEQVVWWESYEQADESDEPEEFSPYRHDTTQTGKLWAKQRLPWPDGGDKSQAWEIETARNSAFDVTNDWDWIAVMGAALGDETMVWEKGNVGNFYNRYSSGRFEPEFEPVELADEDLEEAWRGMARPRTRNEIARAFLKGAVPSPPDSDYEWWETAETGEVVEVVASWRAKLDGKSGEEILKLYFTEGDEEKKELAAVLKVRVGTEEEVAKLREMVLASPTRGMALATEIVKRDGEKGRPFYESFQTRLKEEMAKDYEKLSPEELEAQFQSRYSDSLSTMETLLSGEGFAELYAAYIADEKGAQEIARAMQALGEMEWTREIVEATFAGVLNLVNPTPVRRVYAISLSIYAVNGFLGGENKSATDGDPADVTLPDWLTQAFREQIEAGRDLPVDWSQSRHAASRIWLSSLDTLVNASAAQEAAMVLRDLPEEDLWSHLEARGRARLAGEQPPATPTADSVPAARKTEIEAALSGIGEMDPAKWDAYVASLSVAERLVLRDALAAATPAPAWKNLILRVAEVSSPDDDEWKNIVGENLDAALVERLLAMCRSHVGERSLEGGITAMPLLGGVKLAVSVFSHDEFKERYMLGTRFTGYNTQETAPDFDAVVSLDCYSAGNSFSALRLRGADGAWRVHVDDEPPGNLYGPLRGNSRDEAGFGKEFATFLEDFQAGDRSRHLRFVAFRVPAASADQKP